MTYQQIIDYANIEIDQYRMPFFDPDREAVILYDAIIEFVSQAYMEGERNERRRQDLIDFVRPYEPSGGTNIINLTSIDGFLYVFELAGVFTDPCDAAKTMTRPIKPQKMDKHFRSLIDTFERPDDYYPQYIEYRNGDVRTIEVISDTVPVGYRMYYIKQPYAPSSTELGLEPEFGSKRPICLEVGKIFKRKIMEAADDFNRYSIEQNEIALQR